MVKVNSQKTLFDFEWNEINETINLDVEYIC